MEGHVPTPRLNPALFPSSSGNELASVNERKRFGRAPHWILIDLFSALSIRTIW